MKKNRIIYWIATVLVTAGMLMSGSMYLTMNPEIANGFKMLGYPVYFVYMLGVAKIAGSLLLVLPVGSRVKEWVYAGFAFCFAGAVWSHIATGTPFIAPLVFLAVLAVSYVFSRKLEPAGSKRSVRMQGAAA